jgi:hypothetical protein
MIEMAQDIPDRRHPLGSLAQARSAFHLGQIT